MSRAPQSPSLFVKTQKQVARVYGISLKHAQELLSRAGIARRDGGYDLFALGDWFRGNSDRFGGGATSPEADERPLWALRQIRADALRAEMVLDELRNRYCLREDVERTCREALTTCRLLLGVLPMACAQQVPGKYRGSIQRDVAACPYRKLRSRCDTTTYALRPSHPDRLR